MRNIRYADFGLDEYRSRVRRLQEAMDTARIDVLVITDPANLRYVFGFQSLLQMSATRLFVGVIPKEYPEQSTLFVPRDCIDTPQCWVENVRFWDEGHEPPFDERMVDVGMVANQIGQLGFADGRIGMETGHGTRVGLPAEQFDRLRSLLSRANIIDSSEILWPLRQIKSEAEIDIMRKAASISAKVLDLALIDLREGITERELYRKIHSRMFSEGADGLGLLCVQFGVDGFTRANMIPTDGRKLRINEWAYLDGGASLQGYQADICRMEVLGQATDKQLAIYNAVAEAKVALFNAVKPGVPCGELYRIGTDILKRRGFEDIICSFSVGHGIGLNVHEMPDLNLHNDEPLREGMVLSLEPWVIDRAPDGGLFNVEDMVVVRSYGAELLSR